MNCLPSKHGNCTNVTSHALAPSTSTSTSIRTIRTTRSTSILTSAANTISTSTTSLATENAQAPSAVNLYVPPAATLSVPPPNTTIPISAPHISEEALAKQPVNIQPPTATPDQDPDQDPRHLEPFNFSWGEHSGQEIYDAINSSYEEVVHWKPNCFLVPLALPEPPL